MLPDGVVLIAPSTEPGVSAPLGWALSGASTTQLTKALERQSDECVVPGGRYEGLCGLLRLVSVAPVSPRPA
ncbi:MAG TPA: hypothetical protein VNQ77_19225 [Frankiaceae bacterium]|nr:hypothetical protein [Frankiaceae bacterium]